MRQSIYLLSVMCVSPDAVKRHMDLSLSAVVTGGVGVESYTAVFFSVSFYSLSLLFSPIQFHYKVRGSTSCNYRNFGADSGGDSSC